MKKKPSQARVLKSKRGKAPAAAKKETRGRKPVAFDKGWLEREWRKGLMRAEEIADLYQQVFKVKISPRTIQRYAASGGWVRLAKSEFASRLQERLMHSISPPTETLQTDEQVIEAVVDTMVGVVQRHRKNAARFAAVIENALVVLEDPWDKGIEFLNANRLKTQMLGDVMSCFSRLVAVEREAFAIGRHENPEVTSRPVDDIAIDAIQAAYEELRAQRAP